MLWSQTSTGTVQRLFHQKSYDSTAPGRRQEDFRHRTVPGEV